MRFLRAHRNGRARRSRPVVRLLSMAFAASSILAACGTGDATRTSPCTAPIAGVCTTAAPNATGTPRAIGGGPSVTAPPVAIPSGADAGVAMPQFEYGPDGSVRVGP
jgi:hypothetical protein